MAEAAAASALVGAAPAAPRQPCRRRPPAPRRVADLRCRTAAGEGVPTPLDVLRNDVSYLEDLHGELVAAHRSAHDEVRGPRLLLSCLTRAGGQARRQRHANQRGLRPSTSPCGTAFHRCRRHCRFDLSCPASVA